MHPTLDELATFLGRLLLTDRFDVGERGGVYHPSGRPIRRLGLLLEPWPGLAAWLRRERPDALWVHRPWHLPMDELVDELGDLGVVAHHLPFDERLTTGYNPRLADALGLRGLEVLGRKQGRPLGMLGDAPEQAFDGLVRAVVAAFGGYEAADAGGRGTVARVAVVGAMTDALVREAAARGVDAYLTGQIRQPAQAAIDETGIAVVAVGHRRSEEWGVRALANGMREGWAGLRCLLPPGSGAG